MNRVVRPLYVILSALVMLVIAPASLGETPSAKASTQLSRPENQETPPFRIAVGPGYYVMKMIGGGGSYSALGFVATVGGRVSSNFYLNLDFGYVSATDGKDKITGIAPLPGFTYSFIEQGTVRPYIGVSGGVTFVSDNTDSLVVPTIFVKPGVDFQLIRNIALNLEPAIGVIGPVLTIVPRANIVLRF